MASVSNSFTKKNTVITNDELYKQKYVKYKSKYKLYKNQIGGNITMCGETFYFNKTYYLDDNKRSDCLSPYNIDSVGFSEILPNLYFELTPDIIRRYPYTSVYKFIIHQLNDNWELPISIINKEVYLPDGIREKYKIESDGTVSAEKFKSYFKNYKIIFPNTSRGHKNNGIIMAK
jgi:hypothetical protein